MLLPVDEECRRAIYAATYAAQKVAFDLRAIFLAQENVAQFGVGQSQSVGESKQELRTQALLIFVNAIMHLPEQPVRTGKFCGLGGRLRIWVYLSQREMPENEANFRPKVLQYQIDNWIRGSAPRTLLIAVFDERHWGGSRSFDMVMQRDWNF